MPERPSGPILQTADKPNWHLGRLDALRGLAILGVLVVHAAGASSFSYFLGNLFFNGQRGVQLFFIVSAFTLFLSQDNRRSSEARPTLNYFIRRFFRIAPMYYLIILVTLWLLPVFSGTKTELLLGVFFLQGVSPHAIVHVAGGAWSIADEAFFYCTLPFLARSIRSLRAALVAFAIAAPSLLVGSMLLTHRRPQFGEYFAFFWFPIEFPIFLLGIIVYFLWKEWIAPRAALRAQSGSGTPSSLKVLSLTLLACAAGLALWNIPHDNRKLYPTSIGCALIVVAILIHAWPLLVNRVTIYLGRISFSIYLLHVFVMEWAVRWARARPAMVAHPWLLFAVILFSSLFLTSVLASVTWLYVEETGIRVGRRVIAHLEHRATRDRDTAIPIPVAALGGQSNSQDAQF
jgi:peptidoglycan/LPS O-acetylase OafA/YrhL